MNNSNSEYLNVQTPPDWMLKTKTDFSPVQFLDIRGLNLDVNDPAVQKRANAKLREMLEDAAPSAMKSPALIKIHVGEPDIWQRTIPEYARSTIDFLRARGIDKIVTGDTTVLYSRGRGGKDNTSEYVAPYLELARKHGWLDLGVPFVVLDRSISSVPGVFEFKSDSADLPAAPPNRFPVIRIGAGAAAAGTIINHAHLTGHGLVGVALCVKAVAMGFADRRGKSQMHMAYGPVFNPNNCDRCGICATECPEDALEPPGDKPPELDEAKCVGCGQCMSDCPSGAIEMAARKIDDWTRGRDTMNIRLADFFIGIMNGRWDSVAHVAHMIKITEGCDCLTSHQKEMSPNIGFLVGKNPFAVDRAAQDLLDETAGNNQEARRLIKMTNDSKMYPFIETTHGLATNYKLSVVKY